MTLASLSDQPAGWLPEWGDPAGFVPLLDFWHDLGMTGIGELHMAEHEGPADMAGLKHRYLKSTRPPSPWVGRDAPYEIETLPDQLEAEWNTDKHQRAREILARYVTAADHLLLEMFDEPSGVFFSGDPTYHEGFRDYLQAQIPDCTPAEFGKADWDEVLGFTQADLDAGIDSDMPKPSGAGAPPDVAGARLYYWRLRWWNEASARIYAGTVTFLAAKFGTPGKPVLSPQIVTPFGSGGGYRQGIELQTLLNAGGMTGYIGQAFLSNNERCWGQHLSTYADWVDGHVGPHKIDRRCSLLHFKRGAGAQNALALAAHGMRYINWFTYGPLRLGTADGRAGNGQASMDWLQILRDGSRALAIADPAIAGAKRVTGGVAIVAPQTDQLWKKDHPDPLGYTATLGSVETATHLALTHGHHPVRFLVEERLPHDLTADTKVLLLHRRHLSKAAFDAIRIWVEAGGTLIVIGEAPTRDELAQKPTDRLDFFDTNADEPLAEWFPSDHNGAENYTVTFSGDGTQVVTAYPRRTVADADGSVVLARYDDESPAVVEVTRGMGKVRIVGFVLSRLYIDDQDCLNSQESELPPRVGRFAVYDQSVRNALLGLVGPVKRPASASEPLAEVVRMKKKDGSECLVLLNYTNAETVAITVNVPNWNGTAKALFADTNVIFNSGVASLSLGDVEVLQFVS
jgi:hypothetical protein